MYMSMTAMLKVICNLIMTISYYTSLCFTSLSASAVSVCTR